MTVSYTNLTGIESTKTQYPFSLGGNLTAVIKRMTLDSNYPANGYGASLGVSPGAFGLKSIFAIMPLAIRSNTARNFNAVWDSVNSKLVVYQDNGSIPGIIVEEAVTITANAGRLASAPAYILAVQQSTGGVTGAAKVVPTGSTLGTLQVDVNFTSGAVATFATDAVTQLKVTYIPMGVGPFVPANLVVDELVTLGNGAAVNLANRAALIQYIYNTNGSTAANKAMGVIGSTNAPAANQIYPNLNNGGNTSLLDNAAQNTNVAKVTYWKFTNFSPFLAATADASVNATSNVIKYGSALTIVPAGIVIPAYGVVHAAYATNTDVPSVALGPSGTAAANTPVYDPIKNQITFFAADSITREQFGYVVLNSSQSVPGTGEVAAGTNLSGVIIDVLAIGRPS